MQQHSFGRLWQVLLRLDLKESCGRHQFHGGPSRVATPAELPASNHGTALLHRSGLVRSEGAKRCRSVVQLDCWSK